ncbi:MAG: tRNA dimethylallyltransferase, partial [Candidatus Babeliales bacterium]
SLSIGTAKPDWKNERVKHHLFDIRDAPQHCSARQYGQLLKEKVVEVQSKHKVPIVVGGSSFYIASLFFPPLTHCEKTCVITADKQYSWDLLASIDPKRARELHRNDSYRINRALDIWYDTGRKPSDCKPVYQPLVSSFSLIYFSPAREKLYDIIDKRTLAMFEAGWLDEVRNLCETPWEPFLYEKKLIGYPDICDYLAHKGEIKNFTHLVETIQQKTRYYAKKQGLFWKTFKSRLMDGYEKATKKGFVTIQEVDASHQGERDSAIKGLCGIN